MSTANSGLGGKAGYGEGEFTSSAKAAGDNVDGSVEVDISSVFGSGGLKFFDASYTSLYINTNGLISFGAPNTAYSGDDLADLAAPAIAPFWTDHSLDNGGEIYWDLDPSAGTVTITWHDVAPFTGNGANTYQVVLRDAGNGDLEVEFIYENVDWFQSNGDAAITGITDGQGNDYPLDGSGAPNKLNKYDKNDFGEGEAEGTHVITLKQGYPDFTDGVVDGTGGDDSFVVSNVDGDGDGVTSGADSVLTGLGDDFVDAGDGADTVHGGTGSDTIMGGDGDDQIYGDGILGDATPTTTSITSANFRDTGTGYTVTARNVENGKLTTASVDNVAATQSGIGAGGSVSDTDSGVTSQTGFDLASGLSEQLIIEFDAPVSTASFTFADLYSYSFGEQGQWSLYDKGVLVAQSTFTEASMGSGSGTIDLSGYGTFDQIILEGLIQTDHTDGSDFMVTNVTFESAPTEAYYADSLAGGDGIDAIFGGEGGDTISGDAGNDTLYGEDGDDVIAGGTGDDSVLGGSGADQISGGEGSDFIDGGDGDDLLKTGAGDDTLLGGDGNDTLMNSVGDDSLVGGVGDDLIVATAGNDTLEGGAGDDTLMGGTDGDSLVGGDGNDLLLGDLAGVAFNETGMDGVGLASGINDFGTTALSYEVTFSGTSTPASTVALASYAVPGSDDEFLVQLMGYNLSVDLGGNGGVTTTVDVSGLFDGSPHTIGVTWDSITGALEVYTDGTSAYSGTFATGEVLEQGGSFVLGQEQDAVGGNFDPLQAFQGTIFGARLYDDVRTAGEMADSAFGPVADTSDPNLIANWVADPLTGRIEDRTGNHTMSLSGDAVFTWSAGDDTLLGGDGADTIFGGGGDDYIDGGDGDDLLRTGEGQDTLIGGLGNDTLMNSDGDDSLDGGAGNDSIVATGGEDTLRGGTGDDTMDGGADADTFIIEDGFGNDVITGGEGTTDPSDIDFDTIDLSALTGPVTVTYTGDEAGTITDGTDTITFTEIEHLILTAQDDSLDGAADSAGLNVDAGNGADTLDGGSGGDFLEGGSGADSISGGSGADTLQGGEDNDTVEGGSGDDQIYGWNGDDDLRGGDGDDFITGQTGKDTLQGGSGNDTIDGDEGNDSIDGGAGADSIDAGDGNDTVTYAVGGDTVEGGAGNDLILGGLSQGTDDAVLRGGDGDDTIITYSADDTVFGDAGNDFINADSGDESIDGGADNDTIFANSGDDTITGGTGNDLIQGGGGDDTFIYNVGDGSDTITDFNTGNSGAIGDGNSENNDYINLSGFYDNLTELREDFNDDGVLNQSNAIADGGTVDYSDNDELLASDGLTFQGADQSSFRSDNTGVVCFTEGTAIRTPSGDVMIEHLRFGDLVQTRDNGARPVLWIGRRRLDRQALCAAPHLQPIQVGPRLVGTQVPLLVSPQHGVLIRQDGQERLVRAKHLAMMQGGQARVMTGRREVVYYHILFDAHQIVFANDAPTESFYPGPQAMLALNPAARAEVLELFPELENYGAARTYGVHVRPVSKRFSLPDKLRELAAAVY